MRTREEIKHDFADYLGDDYKRDMYILEVLLDVRELLQNPPTKIVNVEIPRESEEEVITRLASLPHDDYFPKAVEAVRKNKRASKRLLIDELGCTYVKAATLIYQLEAAGIISAPDPKTHRRHVL